MNRYRSRADLVTAVKVIPYTQGTTNMADALMLARNTMFSAAAGHRPNARDMIVLVTDGKSDNGQCDMARVLWYYDTHVLH